MLLNGDLGLIKPEGFIFNNVVFSGSEYDDIEKYQLYDKDYTNQPNVLHSTHSLCLSTLLVKDLRGIRF